LVLYKASDKNDKLISKLDELNQSVQDTFNKNEEIKHINTSRLSEDHNTSVNQSFSAENYLKNNKNFILKDTLIKKEDPVLSTAVKTNENIKNESSNSPKNIEISNFNNIKVNCNNHIYPNISQETIKSNIKPQKIPNENYSYYLNNNQNKMPQSMENTISSITMDTNNMYLKNNPQMNNHPNNFYQNNMQNEFMLNQSNLQQSFSNFNLNSNMNNNPSNFNQIPGYINQNYYHPNQNFPYQPYPQNYGNNVMYPYNMNYNMNYPYNNMNPNMYGYINPPNYINNSNFNSINNNYAYNPAFPNQMNNNPQNVNMLNHITNNPMQNQSQKMSQHQYIKNNNINIINNSVLKVPEQIPNNCTNSNNINTMKSTYENDISNVSSSLKKKIKLDGELQIPQIKAKNVKQTSQNYSEMRNEELVENAYQLAKDQGGCRYLQKKIEEEHDFSNIYLFPKV